MLFWMMGFARRAQLEMPIWHLKFGASIPVFQFQVRHAFEFLDVVRHQSGLPG